MESNRTYISYSQYALFKSSPKAYYEKYALGKEFNGTKYQNFGKKLMENIEFNKLEGVPRILKDIVKSGVVEHEITVKPKFFDKDLYGIIDVVEEGCKSFDEIKTGKNAWSLDMVMKSDQLLFYALMINHKYGIIPKARLIWAETEDVEGGDIKFTGNVKMFTRQFTLEELVDFEKKVLEVCLEISDYEHSIVAIDEDNDAKLLRLLTEKARIEEELELLKSEIMLEIKTFDNKYAESENFNITLAKRTNYTYSDELKDEIKELTEKIKVKKKQEELNGKAKPKTTEYLLIKPKK